MPEDADLYGLGEVTIPTGLKLPRDNRIITLFNADTSSLVPYRNLYGSHPFLLQVNKGVKLVLFLSQGSACLIKSVRQKKAGHFVCVVSAIASTELHDPFFV